MILQPEGIELTETDFEGPLALAIPLAAVLRAEREYLLSNHGFDPQHNGEPYPLLLVRPDGIAAYYAARAAMTSWGTDFGYELINADWKLAYQPPDAHLAKVVQDVLLSSRARQQRLIAAAPAAYSKKPSSSYRSSNRGGAPGAGRAFDDDDSEDSGYIPRQTSGRVGRGYGPPGDDSGGDSPGPTEAQQLASLYGNAGNAAGYGGNSAIPGPGGTIPGGGAIGPGYATTGYGGYGTGSIGTGVSGPGSGRAT